MAQRFITSEAYNEHQAPSFSCGKAFRMVEMAIPFMVDMVTKQKTFPAFSIGPETMMTPAIILDGLLSLEHEKANKNMAQEPSSDRIRALDGTETENLLTNGKSRNTHKRLHLTLPRSVSSGGGGSPQRKGKIGVSANKQTAKIYPSYEIIKPSGNFRQIGRGNNNRQHANSSNNHTNGSRKSPLIRIKTEQSPSKSKNKRNRLKRKVRKLAKKAHINLQLDQRVAESPISKDQPVPTLSERGKDNAMDTTSREEPQDIIEEDPNEHVYYQSCSEIIRAITAKQGRSQLLQSTDRSMNQMSSSLTSRYFKNQHPNRLQQLLPQNEAQTLRLLTEDEIEVTQPVITQAHIGESSTICTRKNLLPNLNSSRSILASVLQIEQLDTPKASLLKKHGQRRESYMLQENTPPDPATKSMLWRKQPSPNQHYRRQSINSSFMFVRRPSTLFRQHQKLVGNNPIYPVLNRLRKHIAQTQRPQQQQDPKTQSSRKLYEQALLTTGRRQSKILQHLNQIDQLTDTLVRTACESASNRREYFSMQSQLLRMMRVLPVQSSQLVQS